MSTSQTLDRGLRALELIAVASSPPTIGTVAAELGVHRSIAYRIVRTLEAHNLVVRDDAGVCRPGVRLAALARSVRAPLQAAALPELSAMADDLGMTAFLVVRDGAEAVTIESVEPDRSAFHVAYKPGVRHPVDRGAPGLALLAADAETADERAEVTSARARGWACSEGEVIPGLASIAAPIDPDAAVAVVYLAASAADQSPIADRVVAAAAAVVARLDRPGERIAS